jgi:hypothetical protein
MINVGTQVIQASYDAVVPRPHSHNEWRISFLIAAIDGNSGISQIEN